MRTPFDGATVTTQNLLGAFTVLQPGDKAVPHRHTAAAIRFSTRAEGAVTIVNGTRCEMKEADLVLTPPMCWHGHINQGGRRTVWFDAANMPAICALDASFFDRACDTTNASGSERRRLLRVPFPRRRDPPQSRFRHTGSRRRPHGALHEERRLGDADARSLFHESRRTTRPRRTTYNAICLVVSGEGRSSIGEQSFEWSQHDVFTIPHWTWASHTSRAAELFIVTDRAIYERLELLREEYG